MEAPLDLVDLQLARTPFEAQVLAGVLEDAEIPAYVEGGARWDEFAVSQRMLSTTGVRLQVPRALLARAQVAIAESSRAARLLEGDVEVEPGEEAEAGPG